MNKNVILAMIGAFGVLAIGVIVCVVSYAAAVNSGARIEENIKAAYVNDQNVLSSYSQKVQEAAQVPAMQRDDLKEIVTAAMAGRYGDGGSKAVFSFIKEQNPNVDQTTYVQLQRIIEAGRNDFKAAQQKLIDNKRVYSIALRSFWNGYWLEKAGYPQIDLDDYKVITSDYSNGAFEKGSESGPIKIR